jgi:hypothetical protein
MKNRVLAGIVLTWAGVFNPAWAMKISVNFDNQQWNDAQQAWVSVNTGPYEPADVGGVVPLANWNNVRSQAYAVPPGQLVDSRGTATGVSLAWTGSIDTWNTAPGGDVGVYGDAIRIGGNTLTIGGVPGTYTLYLYAQDFGSSNPMSITVNGIQRTGYNTTTNQTFSQYGYIENDNYFVWEGLTGDAAVTTEDNRQIGGFQLVVDPLSVGTSTRAAGLKRVALEADRWHLLGVSLDPPATGQAGLADVLGTEGLPWGSTVTAWDTAELTYRSASLWDGAWYGIEADMAPGRGFWIRSPANHTLNLAGLVPRNAQADVLLTEGFQLLSSPYPAAVDLDEVRTPVDGDQIVVFDGQQYRSSSYYQGVWYGATGAETIQPYQGYWYRSASGESRFIEITRPYELP